MNLSSRRAGRGWPLVVAIVTGVTIARVAAASSEQHVDIAYSPLDLMSLGSIGAPVQDLSVSLIALEPLALRSARAISSGDEIFNRTDASCCTFANW